MKGSEVMKTPNAVETAVSYAVKSERLELLLIAKECKDLNELIEKLQQRLKA